MRIRYVLLLTILIGCSSKISSPKYPEIRWERCKGDEEKIKKYLDDDKGNLDPIEGIYSNSSQVTEKMLFGFYEKEISKSNHFARVAIVKENKSFGREFVEVVIKAEDLPKYSIRADFTRVQNDKMYLSKQFSPDGKFQNYTFAFDPMTGFLEGSNKNGAVTPKISYVKLYPIK